MGTGTVEIQEAGPRGPEWIEDIELWHRDPLRMYEDEQRMNRIYNEMWTCEASHSTQDKLRPGATIAPVILSSDKTQLTAFSGDKQAWPVYLSISNIEKATRRQPTSRAMVLIGYIPVCKLECFSCWNLLSKPESKASICRVQMALSDVSSPSCPPTLPITQSNVSSLVAERMPAHNVRFLQKNEENVFILSCAILRRRFEHLQRNLTEKTLTAISSRR